MAGIVVVVVEQSPLFREKRQRSIQQAEGVKREGPAAQAAASSATKEQQHLHVPPKTPQEA